MSILMRIDSIGNNIANLNTNGYKEQDMEFGSMLAQAYNTLPKDPGANRLTTPQFTANRELKMMLEKSKQTEDDSTLREQGAKRQRRKNRQEKKIPWYIKLVGSFLLICISLIAGLAVGYAKMGHHPIGEAFDIQTYKHMYDLVFKLS